MCALCHVLGCKEASECVLPAVRLYEKSVTKNDQIPRPSVIPNTCTISTRPLIFYHGSLTHHRLSTHGLREQGPHSPVCPAPHRPGNRGTPAPTRSRLTPPVCYLQTLCLSRKKPSRTNNKPQINNRPQTVPTLPPPAPGGGLSSRPLSKSALRAHQSRPGGSERRRPQTCRTRTPGSSSPGRNPLPPAGYCGFTCLSSV